jgi:hypothetical protein
MKRFCGQAINCVFFLQQQQCYSFSISKSLIMGQVSGNKEKEEKKNVKKTRKTLLLSSFMKVSPNIVLSSIKDDKHSRFTISFFKMITNKE